MRILVVDDDKGNRELMHALFEVALGHDVDAVVTGEIGLQFFLGNRETMPFDLVVTDLKMPGMNGIELAKAIKAQSPATPVVLVSGTLPPPEEIPRFIDFALTKPFKLVEVEQILEAVTAPVDEDAHLGGNQLLRLGFAFAALDRVDAAFCLSPDGFRARRHLKSCQQCGERQAVLGESVAFSA